VITLSDRVITNGGIRREEAKAFSMSWASIRRAKKELKIMSVCSGFQGEWKWTLPQIFPESSSVAQEKVLGNSAQLPNPKNLSNCGDSVDSVGLAGCHTLSNCGDDSEELEQLYKRHKTDLRGESRVEVEI